MAYFKLVILLSLTFIFACGRAMPCKNSVIDVDVYSKYNCRAFWDCTTNELLASLNQTVRRESLSHLKIEKIGHTPIWIRIRSNKLHCVIHPDFDRKRYRIKIYRAAHYIARLNRILRQGKLKVLDDTEWWSHHSDFVKVPSGSNFPPVFSVSGAPGFEDIPGIPFMSFSDKISQKENIAFERNEMRSKSGGIRRMRESKAFFRGSMSDCSLAVQKYAGDIRFCARAKVVHHAVKSQNELLSGIRSISDFNKVGLNVKCKECSAAKLTEHEFVDELIRHKYVLDFPGAGNWSRRMSLLLRSGALIFQSERPGYQFYEYLLEPGIHYVPFDAQLGKSGAGNLASRLGWAQMNEKLAREISWRSQSFGRECLLDSSINYFLSSLITQYSKRLEGDPSPFSLVDLSSCSAYRGGRFKLTKSCEDSINSCWG